MISTIGELIARSAKTFNRKAFIRYLDNDNYISFFQLEELRKKFNIYLNFIKVFNKDRIVVLMDNSPILAILFLIIPGCFRTFVPINPHAGNEEIEYIISLTKPKLLITNKIFSTKLKKFKIKKIIISEDDIFIKKILDHDYKNSMIKKNVFSNKKDIAQILFTSGSTGNPKGVSITHLNMITNLLGLVKRFRFKKNNPKFISVTPLYHNNGQFIPTLCPLLLGGQTFSIPPMQSLNNFFEIIEKNKINYTSAMATHINYLNNYQRKKKISHLKFICVGGAKLDILNHKKFEKKFGIRILCNYGLTETSSIATTEGVSREFTKKGSVGKPLFNNKVIIKKKKTKKVGEILIKGKNIFQKYYNDRIQSKKKLKNKYLYTGDLGYFDNDGFLYIIDRVDNMINVSGENIYPSEIEKHTNNYKNISLSIAIPVANPITQNSIVLIYEAKNKKKINIDNIKKYLSTKISKFKIPKHYFNIHELNLLEIPKAANKKILRKKIEIYFKDLINKSQISL